MSEEQNTSVLRSFADNGLLVAAVKDIFLTEFAEDEITDDMTDEAIGQVTRARVSGIRKVENAFQKITRHKTTEKELPKINPAR